MHPIRLRGLFVRPLAQRVRDWLDAGKLDEDGLDDALSADARAFVDHPITVDAWAPLEDVEGLVGLAAAQLGGEASLVDWADEIVAGWLEEPSVADLVSAGRRLVDGPGFVLATMGEQLLDEAVWGYEGGRESFSVCLEGLDHASPDLKALLGACLARVAAAADPDRFDVRVEGVDAEALVVFGALADAGEPGDDAEHRLHRAALIP